jgi:hypothetical protein
VGALMNAKEVANFLGLPMSTFHLHRARGAFRHLETLRPAGTRKYARVLVEAYAARQSTVALGRRSA